MELISHHLCPFTHRSIIFLEKKGMKKNEDFKVTYMPVYDLPKWFFDLSPSGRMPIMKIEDDQLLTRPMTINAYLDETIPPSFLPEDPFKKAQYRELIFTGGELLDQMRLVYVAKDEVTMNEALDKLFEMLKKAEKDMGMIIDHQGEDEVLMVECTFAGLFTVMLNFEKIRGDKRWDQMKKVRQYADKLLNDPIVLQSKCPNYNEEFDKFFNYFGSAFKLVA